MKLLPYLSVLLILFCSHIYSKQKIHWLAVHWPPWMILEGSHKGQGFANKALQIARQELTEYEHIPVTMNWARFWLAIQNNKNYCNVLAMKSPKREKIAYFSEPEAIILHNKIIIRKNTDNLLGNPSAIAISTLLKDNRFHGAIEEKRSYGAILDRLLLENNKNIQSYSIGSSSLLQMLKLGRIDYLIEYPIVVSFFIETANTPSTFTSISIKDIPNIFYGHLACTKNNWGKNVINRWNQVLRKLKPTKRYQQLIESGYSNPRDIKIIRQHYQQFIDIPLTNNF